MQVGEQMWRQVELFTKDVLGDLAVEVMLDGVLGCVSTPKHTSVGFEGSFLVAPVCAPSVPESAEGGCTDSWRCELL